MHLPEAQEQARNTTRDLQNKRTEVGVLSLCLLTILIFFKGRTKGYRAVVFTITNVQGKVSFLNFQKKSLLLTCSCDSNFLYHHSMRKKTYRCPPPVMSRFRPDYYFGAVPEKILEDVDSYLVNNPDWDSK